EIEKKMEEVLTGKTKLTLRDVYKQLNAMRKMGPLNKILQMIPGYNILSQIPEEQLKLGEEKIRKFMNIMNSMTYKELDNPDIIDKSRIKRIAKGSGTTPEEVKELLKQYEMTNNLLKMMRRKKGLAKLFEGRDIK
ncbi:signal recognition particle protein Srp19, partial [Sulfolobus sp. SCGC AB-777_G06]